MEAHHLIPMEYYNYFDVSIDVEENIVSLCSNCHREIHHGKDASVIVKKLYEQRKTCLQKAGMPLYDLDRRTDGKVFICVIVIPCGA